MSDSGERIGATNGAIDLELAFAVGRFAPELCRSAGDRSASEADTEATGLLGGCEPTRGDRKGELAANAAIDPRLPTPSLSDADAVSDDTRGYGDQKRQRAQNEPTRAVREVQRPTKLRAFRRP